jgi:hypothetical protein
MLPKTASGVQRRMFAGRAASRRERARSPPRSPQENDDQRAGSGALASLDIFRQSLRMLNDVCWLRAQRHGLPPQRIDLGVQRRGDDAKSAFASCGHAAALALDSNVPIVLQKSFCTVDRKFFEL